MVATDLIQLAGDMSTQPKVIASIVSIYLFLWLLTWLAAPGSLTRQVRGSIAGGWKFDVKEVMCPAPLLFRARSDYVLTSHEGSGEEGWYIWTPWKVYTLTSHYTWIS